MPTARELLEQAEALMRRDRMAAIGADDEFPVLTDAVPEADAGLLAPLAAEKDSPAPAAAVAAPPAPPSAAPGDDLAVTVIALQSAVHAEEFSDQGEPSIWTAPAMDEASISGIGPDSLAPDVTQEGATPHAPKSEAEIEEEAFWHEEFRSVVRAIVPEAAGDVAVEEAPVNVADVASTQTAVAGAGAAFPVAATLDATRWNLMAEDIRMQVLQRIDIFTDTGLREQLAERLKPIVDRASADLVATINQHVGQILRAYVAEAIEREIEKWRQEPR